MLANPLVADGAGRNQQPQRHARSFVQVRFGLRFGGAAVRRRERRILRRVWRRTVRRATGGYATPQARQSRRRPRCAGKSAARLLGARRSKGPPPRAKPRRQAKPGRQRRRERTHRSASGGTPPKNALGTVLPYSAAYGRWPYSMSYDVQECEHSTRFFFDVVRNDGEVTREATTEVKSARARARVRDCTALCTLVLTPGPRRRWRP